MDNTDRREYNKDGVKNIVATIIANTEGHFYPTLRREDIAAALNGYLHSQSREPREDVTIISEDYRTRTRGTHQFSVDLIPDISNMCNPRIIVCCEKLMPNMDILSKCYADFQPNIGHISATLSQSDTVVKQIEVTDPEIQSNDMTFKMYVCCNECIQQEYYKQMAAAQQKIQRKTKKSSHKRKKSNKREKIAISSHEIIKAKSKAKKRKNSRK